MMKDGPYLPTRPWMPAHLGGEEWGVGDARLDEGAGGRRLAVQGLQSTERSRVDDTCQSAHGMTRVGAPMDDTCQRATSWVNKINVVRSSSSGPCDNNPRRRAVWAAVISMPVLVQLRRRRC